MKKLYTCKVAGTYFYDGANHVVAYGDSVVLDTREALKYASSFALATDWNLIFNDQTITKAGGTITRSKTFYKEDLQEWDGMGKLEDVEAEGNVKVVVVTATVVGTMPAGAVTTLDIYDENGSVIENKYEVGGALTNTSGLISFTSAYLNEGYDYKITVAVPQGNPDAYGLTVEVEEIFPALVKSVDVESNGLVAGVNTVTLTAKDADGDAVVAGIFDCYIASNPAGAPAPATTINGIADGGDGDLVEFADDQYIQVFTNTNGECQIAITPADDGTPTVTVLTVSGIPVDGDTIKFGDDTYEFDDDDSVTAGNIPILLATGTTEDDVAAAIKNAFNLNSSYNVTAVDTAGTPGTPGVDAIVTFTATTDFLTYNILATTVATETPGCLAFADAAFGGGTGDSTAGIDPALFYYLAVKYDTGKMFISQRLPWQA